MTELDHQCIEIGDGLHTLAQHDHQTREMFTATIIYIKQNVTVS